MTNSIKKKHITPINRKFQRHGLWVRYSGDKLWYKCLYHNGKEVGYGEDYSYIDGKLFEKKYHV